MEKLKKSHLPSWQVTPNPLVFVFPQFLNWAAGEIHEGPLDSECRAWGRKVQDWGVGLSPLADLDDNILGI